MHYLHSLLVFYEETGMCSCGLEAIPFASLLRVHLNSDRFVYTEQTKVNVKRAMLFYGQRPGQAIPWTSPYGRSISTEAAESRVHSEIIGSAVNR
jgi:hypothetical protein